MGNSVLSSGLSALEILTRFRDAHKGDGNRTDTGLAAAALDEMLPKLEKLEHLTIAEYDEKYGSRIFEQVASFDDRRTTADQVFKAAAEGREYHPLIVFMSKKQYEGVFKEPELAE